MMKVVIAGFGTVGQGVSEVIGSRQALFETLGQKINIVGAFDSSSIISGNNLDPYRLVEKKKATGKVGDKNIDDNITQFIAETDFDILLDTTPTNIEDAEPGLTYILTALNAGKHVITSNKGPLALKFNTLAKAAADSHVQLKYEASVGGAMPIINLCKQLLAGENIESLRGILNGTCNFILNRMKEEGLPFYQALREAQDLGYAEADPTYDIDGIDSAAKVAILANAIFGMNVNYYDVVRSGIRNITEDAIALAAEDNSVIRLIGEIGNGKLEVAPRLVPVGHPLSIGGTQNVANIITDLAGEVTIAGRGAGRKETASAMLSDLISVIQETR